MSKNLFALGALLPSATYNDKGSKKKKNFNPKRHTLDVGGGGAGAKGKRKEKGDLSQSRSSNVLAVSKDVKSGGVSKTPQVKKVGKKMSRATEEDYEEDFDGGKEGKYDDDFERDTEQVDLSKIPATKPKPHPQKKTIEK